MATNDFLPFATDPGANVQPQANYATNPAVDDGFAAGIAESAQCNKTWRQGALGAFVLGELINSVLNEDAEDNGDTATLSDQVLRAVQNANRMALSANTTFYVNAATGNNANSGLAADEAWATLQYAVDWIRDHVDFKGFILTLSVADSAAYAAFAAIGPFTGLKEGASMLIQGNAGAPANVQINSVGNCVRASDGARIKLVGFRLASSGASAISVIRGGVVEYSSITFHTCSVAHINVSDAASIIRSVGAYSITGDAAQHILATFLGMFDSVAGSVVTLTGGPIFSDSFARAQLSGIINALSMSFVGGATGVRYLAITLGNIWVNGGGANFFPGNVAGSTATGGQYN